MNTAHGAFDDVILILKPRKETGEDSTDVVNLTRAYTNPMNGVQSIAFLNDVTVFDKEKYIGILDGQQRITALMAAISGKEGQPLWS